MLSDLDMIGRCRDWWCRRSGRNGSILLGCLGSGLGCSRCRMDIWAKNRGFCRDRCRILSARTMAKLSRMGHSRGIEGESSIGCNRSLLNERIYRKSG